MKDVEKAAVRSAQWSSPPPKEKEEGKVAQTQKKTKK
jgi:hypothetical protein